jgi:nucleotide-binding universal stress UspA family protein
MYEHILIAADGSELSDKAVRQGLELAKAIGAATTIVHVTPPWSSIAVGEVAVMFPPQDYEANMAAAASALLDRIRKLANETGVRACKTMHVSDLHPHSAILTTARENGCDLIVMGSHGRRGIAGLLLGSVTAKTLSHGNIPVLVYRE